MCGSLFAFDDCAYSYSPPRSSFSGAVRPARKADKQAPGSRAVRAEVILRLEKCPTQV